MDDLMVDFLTETNESLADLDVALLKLERSPGDEETLKLIFRLVHTIKGTCGFLGLPRLEHVAHAAENVLGRVRDKALVVTPELVSHVLMALDCIKAIVVALGSGGGEPAGDDSALIAALDAITEGRAPPGVAAKPPASAIAPAPAPAPQPVAEAAAAPPPPPPPAAPPESIVAEPAAAEPQAAEAQVAGQTIRVGVDVIEDLMTLVSELVLTRNQLLQLARSQENRDQEVSAFTVPLQRLSHITSDLQEGVMKTRMQPIGNAWNKLPRLVRDLARDLDKKIDLQMIGADTELDRQVLELIKDPLTHMVRNSGDHGLETPAERRAAGKNETGHVVLNAYHEGGHIVIEIADDGRGLPVGRIRAKVLSQGLATDAELAAMADTDIQRFIFRPGFSTAAAITAVSGRGVGMDVVKTNIERIGGTIDLKSVAGHGTTFTIKIPLTLAIVAALIVEAGGERFAIPQISVVELVRAHTKGTGEAGQDGSNSFVEYIDATPVLRLRDRLLPLINLNDLLSLGSGSQADAAPADSTGAGLTIVVAQVGSSTLGIIVDQVFDTEEIVVKPVAPILRHITMFSGNTILGDGSVIMILDPNGIARATGIGGGHGGEGRLGDAQAAALQQGGLRNDARIAMLLFRAGGPEPKAVPLGLVARLENIAQDRIEITGGQAVTQYRGRLMPLLPMSGTLDLGRERQSVLVFSDTEHAVGRDRCMGLVVDEIIDVVEDHLRIELSGAGQGLLGSAVIAGHATDVIDTGYWLTQAFQDWFRAKETAGPAGAVRLLVVEDSDFFRQMLVPTLSAAGFDVTATSRAAQALHLRDAGQMFDAIISDIEMPDMDGLSFVRHLRAEGPWAQLPVIALSGRVRPEDIERGREAGFTDYVEKFEREALLASLAQCLAQHTQGVAASFARAA